MNIFKNIEEASVELLNPKWEDLDISKKLLCVIKKEFDFDQMTSVQAATIPLMLKNKDVIVEAKTGSGKTLAFLIPIIESLIRMDQSSKFNPHDVLAIILSPTRELATQIHQEVRKFLRNSLLNDDGKIVSQLIVGGNTISNDLQKYSNYGANVIVATPGRLSAIMEMKDNNLSSSIRKKLTYLIFDEADQLLSFGFERDLSSILNYLPKQRRTSLFSATQTTEVEELAKSGLRNPIKVNINKLDKRHNSYSEGNIYKGLLMPEKLTNYYHLCDSYAHKLAVLIEIIKADEYKKVLVFFSTCYQIDYFSKGLEVALNDVNVTILKLHRRLKNKRKAIFKQFKAKKRCILLATDIVSRGLDVPDIACVIHADLPTSPECYVHRSGRSGHQVELSGNSLLLVEKHESDYVEMCKRRDIALEPINLKHLQSNIDKTSSLIVKKLARIVMNDPKLETLRIQAFVSYIRFYSSKLCLRELLFPKLPLKETANSFAIVKLPKMPELRGRLD